MRWRSLLIFVLLLALALGGRWAWREHARARKAEFASRRLAFLQDENRRLTDLLGAQQKQREADDDARLRKGIEKSVTGLRDLPFTKPVVYRQIPRSDLPKVLRQKLSQQVPDQEFTDAGVALAALGLLPPGTDLQKTYLGLLGEQVGAFYDQHTEEVFTFSGQPLSSLQNRVILAHELTHALEDQHFHLANLPLEGKGNDDRALAASALVEGDATLVMDRYMVGNLSAAALRDTLASTFTTDLRQLAAAPRYLRESLLFPYLRGQVFCQALYDRGGWTALAEAFRHPPDCSAQILHPERFLTTPRQEPEAVEYPDTTLLGKKPASDNVLGEFGTQQLLKSWLKDEGTANGIAAGWAGDHYLVYGDGKANSYLWRSVWSTPAAARKFASAARTGWSSRHGLKLLTEPSAASPAKEAHDEILLSSRLPGGRELRIVQDQRLVTLVEAQDADWLRALQALTPPASTLPSTHAIHP